MFAVTGTIIAKKEVGKVDGITVASFVVENQNDFYVGYNYSCFYPSDFEGRVILCELPNLETNKYLKEIF